MRDIEFTRMRLQEGDANAPARLGRRLPRAFAWMRRSTRTEAPR